MNDEHDRVDEADEPRWLELAAALRAEPGPATLVRVRARLAARRAEPAWVRWLSRPVALATCATLLVVSALAGGAMLGEGSAAAVDGESMVSTLLGDDGSYGLPLERADTIGAVEADSEGVAP